MLLHMSFEVSTRYPTWDPLEERQKFDPESPWDARPQKTVYSFFSSDDIVIVNGRNLFSVGHLNHNGSNHPGNAFDYP